ncbi:MAG: C1 family peptidase [Elusimicrobia bacterium]|nr:C1 family peptidase [Elusimicrobiota bacterium]MBK7687874.1 C1 family peptidase [Elusimicrobiota bacterium]MBK8125207.1 C1 family peptidase [Elusimicrobiota bacterium]MBK8424105.1 C1 family peptidase [Elusimicrobiota bacterium]MBK9057709.1 C1 family peptidase [Elusimicrobiota bacterium]
MPENGRFFNRFAPISGKPPPRKIQRYGWIPDLPDGRDFRYTAPRVKLPPKVDLRKKCPAVYDQGDLGSCTANAIGAAHQFGQIKQKVKRDFVPSRLFIYYNERVILGTVNEDSGAMIRDGIKTVVKQGVCPERDWPYVIKKFTIKPPKPCYTKALNHQVVSYRRISHSLKQMQGCLASGYPFVFGFSVYESFESEEVAKTGVVPMPQKEESMIGGHAVLAVGYDNAKKAFIVRNSWGPGWGDKGHCHMPYDYLTNVDLADDLWTIRMVETEE